MMSAIPLAWLRRAAVINNVSASKSPTVGSRCSSLRPLSALCSTTINIETREQARHLFFFNNPYNNSQRLFSTATVNESMPSSSADTSSSNAFDRRNSNVTKSKDLEDNTSSSDILSPALPPLTSEEYNPKYISDQIHIMAGYNQGRMRGQSNSNIKNRKRYERKWDYESVRLALDDYERHLQYVLDHLELDSASTADARKLFANIHPSKEKCFDTHRLLSSSTVSKAARALTRSKMDTPLLSRRIRDLERLVGKIGWTPITEELSYRLLEANGKAGNVRRTLALLELRRSRGYPPREQQNDKYKGANPHIRPGEKEFLHALTSIQSAQLPLRRSRNIYLHESAFSDSALDNPTRYLDAILINMSKRGVSLRPEMAARMLDCYASTGRTGRAIHYFYKVRRDPVEDDGMYIPGPHPTHLGKAGLEDWKAERRGEGAARMLVEEKEESERTLEDVAEEGVLDLEGLDGDDDENQSGMPTHSNRRTKIRMSMQPLPPFHKIPSSVKGVPLIRNRYQPITSEGNSSISNETTSDEIQNKTMTKYEWELDRDWSLALTAAFAFADSLTHGACGHDPIELDVVGWNTLIKACCRRGAIHRALKILNETMPQKGIEPDAYSYNTILAALARVGDTRYLQEYLIGMTNKGIRIDKYTAQAMVDGFLNVGDIQGASSLVQDIFNQHDTLPPYTSHLKIIEFALANGLIFEAKRHVYFIQQLWKWQPSKHHDERFCQLMEKTKRNPKLSKEALLKLFRYFGEELSDQDFF